MASSPPSGGRPQILSHSTDESTIGDHDNRREKRQYANIRKGEESTSEESSLKRYVSINPGDRAELQRIASHALSLSPSRQSSKLERMDTLAGVEHDDPVLNPSSPEFDVYKWARMFMRTMNEENIKSRRAGFTFKNVNVSGSGAALQLQKNVGSVLMAPFRMGEYVSFGKKPEKRILRNFDGVVKSGEMLVVLGRPGSGCSTFLKTICGDLAGLNLSKESVIHYDGVTQKQMMKEFKGEIVYNQEVDKHFPHLTVGETLKFAAASRVPHQRVRGLSRESYVNHITDVVMTVLGLSHTKNTKVGSDFVRGVSGGERKRVSIAEMLLAGSPIGLYDNSTRGLDSATALEFTKALKIGSKVNGVCHAVAIYQASQAIYDLFDKAIVLYEGRQIYQGPANDAKRYFESMGWYCPPRQTTGDFLTSVTNPQERKSREGFEQQVPRTPDDFEQYWRRSSEFVALQKDIQQHEDEFPIGGEVINEFKESHRAMQAKHTRDGSPYVISIPMQVKLCIKRAYQRIINDKASTITTVISQVIMALVVGSVFYGTPDNTESFFAQGSVLFFAVLLNALIAITEINRLYDQRPIVEKQASYAFYHPFTEALAGIVSDIPVKLFIAVIFNIILYFLAGLRREPSQFFIFFLFNFMGQMTTTAMFRTIAAATKTISSALTIAGVLVLAIVIYTGFTIPRPYMHPWFKWLSWINPIAYAYEALLVNNVHGRQFPCSALVPSYPNLSGDTFICGVAGAVAGQTSVSGDDWVQSSYGYSYSHIWRNLGFLFAFMLFFMAIYLLATELNSSTSSAAEVLVFRRGHVPSYMQQTKTASGKGDGETDTRQEAISQEISSEEKVNVIPPQKDIFTWRDVVYDIKIKGEPRRLLDHVSGWVKPGTLTALMGVSGAGKTTLLDALAQRTSIGVITGDMFVNGRSLDESFQRKTGYVQQQDLHLETSTVREALRFSAILRQPASVTKSEKYEFVEDVIKMLNMEDFSEAVVGQPGQGLNVEQRKLLTIGVELAAKPALLLFLDEPTSGLDSQSSWAIVAFLRKLADNGQAVLSTIHQPSSILFQEFDRLLFLAKGGRTVYFGNIGQNSETLVGYFESHGARHCSESENPAEFMLEIVGAGATGKSTQDWHDVWKGSQECQDVQIELSRIHAEKSKEEPIDSEVAEGHEEFAMPFWTQLQCVMIRVFQQYWRTPTYIWGKLLLGIMSSLFIGFSFYMSDSSQQGLQNIIFSVFMITTIFTSLVQQIMPRFITQRSLYEVRERPSKAYSWAAFLISNIVVEIPYQILLGVLVFGAYYYPTFGIQSSQRQGLILLFCIQFFIFASTFAHALIVALPDAETAGNIATLLFSMSLIFNGVMQPPSALPGFWIFMYRVSPLTYIVDGIVATGLHGRAITCSRNELSVFNPPAGQTCGQYLASYLAGSSGKLLNADATTGCEYCSLSTADQFLAMDDISWDTRWRNFGIVWVYIVFNIAVAVLFYYCFRVKKWSVMDLKGNFGGVMTVGRKVGALGRQPVGKSDEKVPAGNEAVNDKIL